MKRNDRPVPTNWSQQAIIWQLRGGAPLTTTFNQGQGVPCLNGF